MTHMYFSARAEGIRTFRHALRAAYRTAISAAQILVYTASSVCACVSDYAAEWRGEERAMWYQVSDSVGCFGV